MNNRNTATSPLKSAAVASATTSARAAASTTTAETSPIRFSNEDSKAAIRAKISHNLVDLVELTRTIVKNSQSTDLFKSCFKSLLATEPAINNCCDRIAKIEIITTQLNYQVEAIRNDCAHLDEICQQVHTTIHSKQQQQQQR